jgi:hypothetical protein
LKVNAENVFQFSVDETTQWNEFGPTHDESLGEIAMFIEGPWVVEVAEFWQKVKGHSEVAWKERNAPREARELDALKKRFGI